MKINKQIVLIGTGLVCLIGLLGVGYLWRTHRITSITNRVKAFVAYEAGNVSMLPFEFTEIDATAGDIKLVGDIDGDNFPDLIIGGSPSEPLSWYHYPEWDKHIIATANTEFTTDGALGDVDGDGDLDIVVPDGNSDNNVLWFKNPRPNGDPTVAGQWQRFEIGATDNWAKDIELADFDDNGRLDVATRRDSSAMIFFQVGDNTWSKMTFNGVSLGNEGMASGDVDSDGHVDIVLRGVWVKNPGGSNAQTASNWTQYDIGSANSDFKALVVDLNQDNHNDVLFSSSENTADVDWWEADGGDPTGSWTKHTILSSVERAHTLQAADMDLDGDLDVVLAQMHTSATGEIMVLINQDGTATTWSKEVVATGGLHNGVVADIGNDGDFDIYGANWTGNPPVRLWENRMETFASVSRWTYKEITNNHAQTFGLTFGDVNQDGSKDILSGRYWYQNPEGDMLGDWVQRAFPDGMHATMVMDVDGDKFFDVIAQKDETDIALYWLEATDVDGSAWNSVKIGTVNRASHELGAQGYQIGQVESGGKPEVVISSGSGIYYFAVPANPSSGNWPRTFVNGNPSDEGFALGDIDKDGHLDIVASTGDSKRIEWYKNPGDGSSDWQAFHIGDFSEAAFPDRAAVADMNQDGRLDIIITEENGIDTDAESFWWEQPENPQSPNWTRHLITSQATTNSMSAADMNQDGMPDLVLGEHRGMEKLSIWLNDGSGNLLSLTIDSGKESHLGAQAVDLDGDNDLDIVSIAWDDPQKLHMWRNDADPAESLIHIPIVINNSANTQVAESSTSDAVAPIHYGCITDIAE